MAEAYGIVNSLLRSEKGTDLAAKQNKYLFSVKKDANKIQIKKAVEDIYKVKVLAVNTEVMPGKMRRVRFQYGRTPEVKKAIVTLKEGQKIDLA